MIASTRTRRVRIGPALLALVLFVGPECLRASTEGLPPGHWAYQELDHFEARGWIRLHGVRPYTRREVRDLVVRLTDTVPHEDLSRVEHQRLARLRNEFVLGEDFEDAGRRFDPPWVRIVDKQWGLIGDVEIQAGGAGWRTGAPDRPKAWALGRFETAFRFGHGIVYETRYSLAFEEQEGRRTEENRLSSRERNWKGLTSHHDRASVAFEGGVLQLRLGRDYVGWGVRPGEALLLSDTGFSLDGFVVHLNLGRFRLASVTALLSAREKRHYSAHRLELGLGRVVVGFQEAVVYQSPYPDVAYLFPVSSFYGNQFNERGDDNVLVGADLKWVSKWGVWDTELLVDDFIYDGDPAPHKLGWRAGFRHAWDLRDTDLALDLDYARIGRWTYTHRQGSKNYYVAGHGDPASGDPFLGSAVGPDADRWSGELRWMPNVRTSYWLRHTRSRRGDGNRDLSAWEKGDPYDLGFPSGVVHHEWETEVGSRVWLGRTTQFRWILGHGHRNGQRELWLGGNIGIDL